MSSFLGLILRIHSKRGTFIKMLEIGLFPWVGIVFIAAAINSLTGFEIAKTEGGFIAISLIVEVILLSIYIFLFSTKYTEYINKNSEYIINLNVVQKTLLKIKLNLKEFITAVFVIILSCVLTLFYQQALTYIGLVMLLNIPILFMIFGDEEYINVRIIN